MVELCTFSKLFIRSLHCVYVRIVIVALFGVGLRVYCVHATENSAMHRCRRYE